MLGKKLNQNGSSDEKQKDIDNFYSFLTKHKVVGEGVEHTHTCFGPPYGKYNIPDEDLDPFYDLYSKVMGHIILHVTERPKDVGPLLIDIDMKFNDVTKRQYKENDITYLVTKINLIIKTYFQATKKMLKAFILEKKTPSETKNKGETKDGFHIVYPYLPIPKSMRYLILHEIKEAVRIEDKFGNLNYTNSLDDVFDSTIVWRNGWMLYGSRKEGCQMYRLTNVYKFDGTYEDITVYANEELVKIMSNRIYQPEDAIPYKTDGINQRELDKKLNLMLQKYEGYKKERVAKNVITDYVDEVSEDDDQDLNKNCQFDDDEEEDDGDEEVIIPVKRNENNKFGNKPMNNIELAKKMLNILNKKRYEEWQYWHLVGWALHNISVDLLDAFKEFSKKTKRKGQYKEKSCDELWAKARSEGLGIGSLCTWAREDNPAEYSKIIRENMNQLFAEAESGLEFDVAQVVYELYKYTYKCASISNCVWYEFQGHRWIQIDKGYTLRRKLSTELTGEFANLSAAMLSLSATKVGQEQDILIKKSNNINKLILKLKKSSFKSSVMSECADFFYVEGFEGKLNENKFLVGFENGIYDLKNGCFRPGTPDDMVSFNTGYNWVEYNMKDKKILEILHFFNTVQTEDNMREYILCLLATYLDGRTDDQKVIIWTGTGRNGKSKTVELFQKGFGSYCGSLPITVLTKGRGTSGAANPEIAKQYGKRFVVFQEPEAGDKINVGYMKELSGGDKIMARPLYKDPFEFYPQFKLLLTCNRLPEIPSTDSGTWRRLRVSPWESEFVDIDENGKYDGNDLKPNQFPRDYSLTERIEEWKDAFMWLLITQYYPKIKATEVTEGDNRKVALVEPDKVKLFTDKYRKMSDVYLEFLDDQVIRTKNKSDFISLDSLYQTFKGWYREAHANNQIPSKKELKEYLVNHDIKCDNRTVYCMKYNVELEPAKNVLDD